MNDECSLIFIRDLRGNGHAPAQPRCLVHPESVDGWTAQDVLTSFRPDNPVFSAELYTVGVQCNPTTLQAGRRLSNNLFRHGGPLPPGHLELVLKQMNANGEQPWLAGGAHNTEDTDTMSSGSIEVDSDASDDAFKFYELSPASGTEPRTQWDYKIQVSLAMYFAVICHGFTLTCLFSKLKGICGQHQHIFANVSVDGSNRLRRGGISHFSHSWSREYGK